MDSGYWTGDEAAEGFARRKRTNGAHADDDARAGLQFRHVAELDVGAPDWLVKHLMECNALGVAFGDAGTGKSLFAMDLGLSIAAGVAFHGHEVKQGPVLYLPGEGQRGISRRVRAWCKRHGIDVRTVPFYVSTMPTALTDASAQAWLRDTITRFTAEHGAPVLIIPDTLARNFGNGDENSTRDMGIAVRACDLLREQTGATILIPHHTGHGDKSRARGAVALRCAADFEYGFTAEEGVITVLCHKQKDTDSPAPMAFRLDKVMLDTFDEDGAPVTSVVLTSVAYQAPQPRATAANEASGRHQIKALGVLHDLYEHHRANVVKSGRDASCARVEVHDWRLACLDPSHGNMKANRFDDAKRRLRAKGLIVIEGVHVLLPGMTGFDRNRPEPGETGQETYQ